MTDIVKFEDAIPNVTQGSPEMVEKLRELYRGMTIAPEGMEDADINWNPEVVKIKHPTTTDAALPGDAREGDIWATGRVLWSRRQGEEDPFLFVPVNYWKEHSRFQNNERKPNCSSPDGITAYDGTICKTCPDFPWRNGQVQDCRRAHNFLVLPLDLSGIYSIRFSKTSSTAGTNILKTSKGRGRPMRENVYGLWTKQQSNSAGQSWYTYQTGTFFDTPLDPAFLAFAEWLFHQHKEARSSFLAGVAETREMATAALTGAADLDDVAEAEGFEDSM